MTIGEDHQPKVTLGTNTTNKVTVYATYSNSAYLTLEPGKAGVELNAFIIPQENLTVTSEWTLTVTLADGGVYKKKLGATTGTDSKKYTLKPGMIHRLPTLGSLNPKD